jgi:protein-disulfide isomerase
MAPAARGAQTMAGAASLEATGEKVVSYVRVHFGILDAVKLTISPWRSSVFPDSYDATLTLDDGKQQKQQMALISRDGRYLILVLGDIVDLAAAGLPNTPAGDDRVVPIIRGHFKVPETVKLTLSPARSSVFPRSREATLTMDNGQKKQEYTVLISKDGRYLILVFGDVIDLNFDVKREALRAISMTNQASQGPANAPVTIVEYADLECPMCARVHEFFEQQLLPKYGNKVRLVFKENPLVAIHDWALAASLAGQCIYQTDPGAYVPFRTLVFRNQMSVSAGNSREMLLVYAEQVGVDRVKLAPCLDAKTTLPRVEENMAEAKRLKITSTPTCFVNGKMIVGFPSADAYFKAVDEALGEAR